MVIIRHRMMDDGKLDGTRPSSVRRQGQKRAVGADSGRRLRQSCAAACCPQAESALAAPIPLYDGMFSSVRLEVTTMMRETRAERVLPYRSASVSGGAALCIVGSDSS